ncbi:hypothetical protein H5410_004391 [Solanum commersonii]|uniref:DUF7746 domain-containing protein n=1 Tax=Solanum commersonii TaxID=4109 RepID=A0A9J6B7W5_SOLCO|nr:hypothetical protein H5410_004391 [Solanum commersonii]
MIVNFNAFSKLFENDTILITAQHINVMIKQNNYANIYMSILGDHVISLHEKVDKLITLLSTNIKGKEKVANSSVQPPPDIEDFKIKDYSDLENFLEKKFMGGVQPIDVENFDKGEPSNKKEFYDNLNKISEKYARKPVQMMYYYPRPTPQDVLLEEHEHIITNSYNGKEIYEWNIDGYTDRQIYTTIHRIPTWAPPSRRGRGRTNPGKGGHILAQQGNKTLTSFNVNDSATSSSGTSGINVNHPMYKEFMNFMKSKTKLDNNPAVILFNPYGR